jgi:hypothetical protein
MAARCPREVRSCTRFRRATLVCAALVAAALVRVSHAQIDDIGNFLKQTTVNLDELTSPPSEDLICQPQQRISLEPYNGAAGSFNVINLLAKVFTQGSDCCTRWECKKCEQGKFGASTPMQNAACHDCPLLAPSLMTPKQQAEPAPRWCSNVCAEHFRDQQTQISSISTVVQFEGITTEAQAKNAVMHLRAYSWGAYAPVCKMCNSDSTVAKLKTQDLLSARHVAALNNLLSMYILSNDEFNWLNTLAVQGPPAARGLDVFEWTVCLQCPTGMIAHDKWEVSEDVVQKTLALTGRAVEAVPFLHCKACPISSGYAFRASETSPLQCVSCPADEFQVAYNYEEFQGFVTLVNSCQRCASGFQAKTDRTCRSITRTATLCCDACLRNKWRTDLTSMQKCVEVDKDKVGVNSIGQFVDVQATQQKACQIGQQLMYCSAETANGICITKITTGAWKTCVSCSLDERQRDDDSKPGCDRCPTTSVRSKTNGAECTKCPACQEIVIDEENGLLQQLSNVYYISAEMSFYHTKTTATFQNLQTRKVAWSGGKIQIQGQDDYRPSDEEKGRQINNFHFVDKKNECKMTHCSQHCQGFHYAEFCGIQSLKTLLKNQDGIKMLADEITTDPGDVSKWQVVTEGNCTVCSTCVLGQHNSECNTPSAYQAFQPQGVCKDCKTSCAQGYYMFHPETEAGCHHPATGTRTDDTSMPLKYEIKHDYECKECPTWVKQGEKLKVVTNCGLKNSYTHHSEQAALDSNKQLSKQIYSIDTSNPYHKFKQFLQDAKNYCPLLFFFNSKIQGCDFVQTNGQDYKLPPFHTLTVGFDDYNPKCCELCTTCDPPLQRKNMDFWKQCPGHSMTDLQNQCSDKCLVGYWQDDNDCRQCSTCQEGIL